MQAGAWVPGFCYVQEVSPQACQSLHISYIERLKYFHSNACDLAILGVPLTFEITSALAFAQWTCPHQAILVKAGNTTDNICWFKSGHNFIDNRSKWLLLGIGWPPSPPALLLEEHQGQTSFGIQISATLTGLLGWGVMWPSAPPPAYGQKHLPVDLFTGIACSHWPRAILDQGQEASQSQGAL